MHAVALRHLDADEREQHGGERRDAQVVRVLPRLAAQVAQREARQAQLAGGRRFARQRAPDRSIAVGGTDHAHGVSGRQFEVTGDTRGRVFVLHRQANQGKRGTRFVQPVLNEAQQPVGLQRTLHAPVGACAGDAPLRAPDGDDFLRVQLKGDRLRCFVFFARNGFAAQPGQR